MSGHRIFRLANGQYLLTGRNWTHYDGQPAGVVVRLHHDGALDTSFHFNSAESYIPAIHEQEDGKIIMAGIIWMDGNPDTLDIVRIHLDGSLDTTFNNHTDFRFQPYPHSDLLGEVLVVEPLDAGRLLVGGYFNEANGEPRGSIACIDTAGNLLDCWAGGGLHPTGAPPYPSAVLYGFECFGDLGCYLYGHYAGITDANGWHPDQLFMSRLHMPDVGVPEHARRVEAMEVWPNPGSGTVHLQWPGVASARAEVRDGMGRTALGSTLLHAPFTLDLAALPSGLYHVLLTASDGRQAAAKWMKQ